MSARGPRDPRALLLVIAGGCALGWWAWPDVPPPDATVVPPRVVAHAAAPEPFVIEAPPPALITEAPTRPDGLDRGDPCALRPTQGPPRIPMLYSYVERRRAELEPALVVEATDAVGDRFREALHAPAPAIDAGVEVRPGDAEMATLVGLSLGAWQAHHDEAALRYAQDVIRLRPDDPLGFVLAYLASSEPTQRRAALVRAFRLAPREPEISFWTALALGRTSDVMGELAAADAYLDVEPDPSMTLLRGRAAAVAHAFAAGSRRSRGPITVVGTSRLDETSAEHLVDVVQGALTEAETETGVVNEREVAVLVFEDAESMRRATCVPTGGAVRSDRIEMLRTGAGEPGADGALHDAALALAVRRASSHAPRWLTDALLERVRMGEAVEDRAGYARLLERDHWIAPEQLGRTLATGDTPDARIARAEARGILEWLIARRGDAVLLELGPESGTSSLAPLPVIEALGHAPFDEPTFRAFLSTRVQAPSISSDVEGPGD